MSPQSFQTIDCTATSKSLRIILSDRSKRTQFLGAITNTQPRPTHNDQEQSIYPLTCRHVNNTADLAPEFWGHIITWSARARTYKVWAQSPQRGPGTELPVKESGGFPEAERLFALSQPKEPANFSWNLMFLQNKTKIRRTFGAMGPGSARGHANNQFTRYTSSVHDTIRRY